MAKLEPWRLFREHRRRASATSEYQIQFAEYDWGNGRFIVVKQKKLPAIPVPFTDQLNEAIKRKKR
jgi:hypothetical protein